MVEVYALSEEIINEVRILLNKLKSNFVSVSPNPILREDIFDILSQYCTIVYYPIENERNHGFHIKDKNKFTKAKDIVYINTAHTLDKQVFTAAHELGHILEIAEDVCSNLGLDFGHEIDDKITNYFAAELIMPPDLFIKSYEYYAQVFAKDKEHIQIDEFLKMVSMLMNEFLVPYKSVIFRCFEVKLINKQTAQALVDEYEKDESYLGEILKNINLEQGHVRILKSSKKKYIKDLAEVLDRSEKSGRFTEEKISNMRKLFELQKLDDKEVELGIKEIGKNGIVG